MNTNVFLATLSQKCLLLIDQVEERDIGWFYCLCGNIFFLKRNRIINTFCLLDVWGHILSCALDGDFFPGEKNKEVVFVQLCRPALSLSNQ